MGCPGGHREQPFLQQTLWWLHKVSRMLHRGSRAKPCCAAARQQQKSCRHQLDGNKCCTVHFKFRVPSCLSSKTTQLKLPAVTAGSTHRATSKLLTSIPQRCQRPYKPDSGQGLGPTPPTQRCLIQQPCSACCPTGSLPQRASMLWSRSCNKR